MKVGDSIEEKDLIPGFSIICDYIRAHINWTDDGIQLKLYIFDPGIWG